MRILTVVGNRPQFIKAAAVSGPLRERHEEVLVHTGQHHDERLSRVFFEELGLARPDRELGVAGASNTSQTARMLAALEPVIEEERPEALLVYGDTNSTLAGALAGAQAALPVLHVEAGMRSYDMTMPEELNRVLVDHASALLLCASETAAENLRAEGVRASVALVGDVMVDVALRWQPRAREDHETLAAHGLERGEYLLLTVHRAGNVDDDEPLAALVDLIGALAGQRVGRRLLFPVHPRTRRRLRETGLEAQLERSASVRLCEPLPYAELSALVCQARAVLTDSGGVQKEAYIAGVPCITLRERTEWVETVQSGWNALVGLDADAASAALERAEASAGGPPFGEAGKAQASLPAAAAGAGESADQRAQVYGGGEAAARCIAAIDAFAASAMAVVGAEHGPSDAGQSTGEGR